MRLFGRSLRQEATHRIREYLQVIVGHEIMA
jgi:hypothetical protein